MTKPWWHEPLRIVQVNLQVLDTPQMDPKEMMRRLRQELHANVVVFNAGGIYAWYPTEVPYHFVNPLMEGRDLLGEAVQAAHEYGLKFIARVDFSKADDSIYHQHPEWFVKEPDGQPRAIGEPRYGPWSLLYATCANGAYRNEAVAHPVMKEILSTYDVDALFYNGAGFIHCHCAECQHRYRELYNQELPADAKLFSPSWRTRCRVDHLEGIYRVSKAVRPDVAWLGGFGLGSDRDLTALSKYADVPCSEPLDQFARGRSGQRPRWWSGVTSQLGRTLNNGAPPIIIIHACPGLTWRHTTLPDHENRFWLAQTVAHGANIWHTLTGYPETQYDQRILEGVGAFNALLETHEDALADLEPVTPVAVVHSRHSTRRSGTEELWGFCEALVNHQIPFTVIPAEYLTPERLAVYEVIVLPDTSSLGDQAIAALEAFVSQGGKLVASYECGLYDQQGNSREHLGLGKALGLTFRGHRLRNLDTSYMRIEAHDHPLLSNVGNTQLVPNALDALQVTTNADVPLTLVPPFAVPAAAGSPPERASIPSKRTGIPMAVCQPQSVYFANQIGRLVWRYRLPDHQDLIANAVRAVAHLPIEVDGPHSLQVSLYRQGEGYVVHLINATGDRPLQDTIPLQNVRIRLCIEHTDMLVQTLLHSANLACNVSDGILEFVVPRVETWEIVRCMPA